VFVLLCLCRHRRRPSLSAASWPRRALRPPRRRLARRSSPSTRRRVPRGASPALLARSTPFCCVHGPALCVAHTTVACSARAWRPRCRARPPLTRRCAWHRGAAERAGHHPGRRRWHASVPADQEARKACGAPGIHPSRACGAPAARATARHARTRVTCGAARAHRRARHAGCACSGARAQNAHAGPNHDSRVPPRSFAAPQGGNYRLIDIPVSNCINSEIVKIYCLTQFNSASLNRHLSSAYVRSRVARARPACGSRAKPQPLVWRMPTCPPARPPAR
jgi:hypothetical protein